MNATISITASVVAIGIWVVSAGLFSKQSSGFNVPNIWSWACNHESSSDSNVNFHQICLTQVIILFPSYVDQFRSGHLFVLLLKLLLKRLLLRHSSLCICDGNRRSKCASPNDFLLLPCDNLPPIRRMGLSMELKNLLPRTEHMRSLMEHTMRRKSFQRIKRMSPVEWDM